MGMYTELVVGIRLKDDLPKHIMDVIKYMTVGGDTLVSLPDHPLFQSSRWEFLLRGSSYYFPVHESHTKLRLDGRLGRNTYLDARASIKNYTSEIEQFFDWICPYAESGYGNDRTFLGYSLYEESDSPKLYFKDNETGGLVVKEVAE